MSRKRVKKDKVDDKAWLETFGDLMTQLLTFFVMLYATSTVSQEKLIELSEAFELILKGNMVIDSEGPNNGNTGVIGEGEIDLDDKQEENKEGTEDKQEENKEDTEDKQDKEEVIIEDETDKIYKYIEDFILKEGIGNDVIIREDYRGIVIQLKDSVFFDSGYADLKPNSISILNKINTILKEIKYNIIVEGHTDNVPIKNSKFDSNWELSTTRAVNVVRFFIETRGMTPSRFSAVGYGEYKPIAPNDNQENKAKNRRIDIVILTKSRE